MIGDVRAAVHREGNRSPSLEMKRELHAELAAKEPTQAVNGR